MAEQELVHVLDYILNRCGKAEIEAVAAAVVRRRRDLTLFGANEGMDPTRWAKNAAKELSQGSGSGLNAVRRTVRDMAAGMLRKEAPELTEEQISELLGAWVPGGGEAPSAEPAAGVVDADSGDAPRRSGSRKIPRDLLAGMVEQFVAFSQGVMSRTEESALKQDLGDWTGRYWNAFPGGVRAVVSEHLKGGTDSREFRSKLAAVLDLENP